MLLGKDQSCLHNCDGLFPSTPPPLNQTFQSDMNDWKCKIFQSYLHSHRTTQNRPELRMYLGVIVLVVAQLLRSHNLLSIFTGSRRANPRHSGIYFKIAQLQICRTWCALSFLNQIFNLAMQLYTHKLVYKSARRGQRENICMVWIRSYQGWGMSFTCCLW